MFFWFVGILGQAGVGVVNGGDVWCALVWQSFSKIRDVLKWIFCRLESLTSGLNLPCWCPCSVQLLCKIIGVS
jgi:hypothetical protein